MSSIRLNLLNHWHHTNVELFVDDIETKKKCKREENEKNNANENDKVEKNFWNFCFVWRGLCFCVWIFARFDLKFLKMTTRKKKGNATEEKSWEFAENTSLFSFFWALARINLPLEIHETFHFLLLFYISLLHKSSFRRIYISYRLY